MSLFLSLYKRTQRKLRYLSLEGDGLMVISLVRAVFAIAVALGEAAIGYWGMVFRGGGAVLVGCFGFCAAVIEIVGVVGMRVAAYIGECSVGFFHTVYSVFHFGIVKSARGILALGVLIVQGVIFLFHGIGVAAAWCFGRAVYIATAFLSFFVSALHSLGAGVLFVVRIFVATLSRTIATLVFGLQYIGLVVLKGGKAFVRGVQYCAQWSLALCMAIGRMGAFVVRMCLRGVSRSADVTAHAAVGASRATVLTAVRTQYRMSSFVRSFDITHPPLGWQRSVAGFVVVSMFFVLPFPALYAYQDVMGVKNRAQVQGKDAIMAMQRAQSSLTGGDMKGALDAFNAAYQSFQNTEKTIGSINEVVRWGAGHVPLGGEQLVDAERLVSAGKDFSLAGRYLSSAADAAVQLRNTQDPVAFSALIASLEKNLILARPHLAHAVASLGEVDSASLPADYRSSFEEISSLAPRFEGVLDHAIAVAGLMRYMIGVDTQRRFLVVFQNETELRPTGGFMGTVAIVDIDQGKIKNISIPGGGPYDFRGTLTEHVTSPHPLWLVNPAWQLQDANWFPDFPESAAKTAWFYKKSGGSTVDGVIAINSGMASDLLRLVGAVSLPAYGKVITPDNVLIELQKAVEIEYDRTENQPKKILADLLPIIIQRLGELPADRYGDAGALLLGAFDKKHIQVYATDATQQASLETLGIAGEMKPVDGDYLMVVDTNIGGGKTDGHIQSEVSYDVHEGDGGVLTATLKVTRTHTGTEKDIFANVNNVDYFRAYTPKGSRLIHAEGFEIPERTLFKNPPLTQKEDSDLARVEGKSAIDQGTGTVITQEGDKTVFGNWIQTKPQETSVVTLVYELPFSRKDLSLGGSDALSGYRLYVQKQSGSSVDVFRGTVTLGKGQKTLWASRPFEKGSATFSWEDAVVGRDIIIGSIFQK